MPGRAGDVRAFYDGLAADYHLLFADWAASVERQGEALHRLVEAALGAGPRRILDAACGIGTQSIGLARRGHQVTGTDLSPAALARARAEGARLGLAFPLAAMDLRDLDRAVRGTFDVVLAVDNALPHLAGEELARAALALRSVLRPGGLLVATTRDYDRLVEEHPPGTLPMALGPPGRRRIVFQSWTWEDARTYRLELFILLEGPEGWEVRRHLSRYHAIRRGELGAVLASAGFDQVRWLEPGHSGLHQPAVTARAR